MMHGGHHRKTHRRNVKQPKPQALVVMDDVEVVAPVGEQSGGAQAERARLGESGRPHGGQLEKIDSVADFAGARNTEGIGFPVHVQARYFAKHYPRIEHVGIGLAGEHLDVVAEFDEAAAQVTDIDALSATVCFAAVGQQSDPHAHPFCYGSARWVAPEISTTSASCLDTCLDYNLTTYVMQRTS